MPQSLLLDTHVALWLDTGDRRLRPATRQLIETTWRNQATIFFSAVSAWEIAKLADIGRFSLDLPVNLWVARFLKLPGVAPAPLTPQTAANSHSLTGLTHRDPGDRLLIATAIDLATPLVTYDTKILDFFHRAGAANGFTAIS